MYLFVPSLDEGLILPHCQSWEPYYSSARFLHFSGRSLPCLWGHQDPVNS